MTDSDATCPVYGTEVRDTRQVGAVTYELDPCGHEVDDETHADLLDE